MARSLPLFTRRSTLATSTDPRTFLFTAVTSRVEVGSLDSHSFTRKFFLHIEFLYRECSFIQDTSGDPLTSARIYQLVLLVVRPGQLFHCFRAFLSLSSSRYCRVRLTRIAGGLDRMLHFTGSHVPSLICRTPWIRSAPRGNTSTFHCSMAMLPCSYSAFCWLLATVLPGKSFPTALHMAIGQADGLSVPWSDIRYR